MGKEKGSEFPIGYKKPPLHTRFKSGQSGNPNGRPKKKAKTLPEWFDRELNTLITVNENGRQRQITKLQATAKQITNKAVTGDHKATSFLMKTAEQREFEQTDALSSVLHAMRAVHSKHEDADRSRAIDVSDNRGNEANDRKQSDDDQN